MGAGGSRSGIQKEGSNEQGQKKGTGLQHGARLATAKNREVQVWRKEK